MYLVQPTLLTGPDSFTRWTGTQPILVANPAPILPPFAGGGGDPVSAPNPVLTYQPTTNTQTPQGTSISPVVPRAMPPAGAMGKTQQPTPATPQDNMVAILVVVIVGFIAWRALR
jgi:hypothetical protein